MSEIKAHEPEITGLMPLSLETLSADTDLVKDQLHDLRLDLRRLQVNGVTGNLFLWWIHPVKFLADPGKFMCSFARYPIRL